MPVSKGDANRLFIQAFMSRSVMSDTVAKMVHKKCIAAVKQLDRNIEPEADFQEFFTNIRNAIANLQNGMEVHSMVDGETGNTLHILINQRGDALAQLATEYTASEIAYYKLIIDQIMTAPSESFSISDFGALRERDSLPQNMKLTPSQAEALLDSFVARGWLAKSQRSRYSLASRAIAELQPYIHKNYEEQEDLKKCDTCDEYVLKGLRCLGNKGKCQVKIHRPCFDKWVRQQQRNNASPKCTVCNGSWADVEKLKIVGEGAVADGAPEPRRRKARSSQNAVEEGDSDEEVDEGGSSQKKRSRKKSSVTKLKVERKSRKKATENEDEDVAMSSPEDSEPALDDAMQDDDDDDDLGDTPPPPPPMPTRRSGRR